ncbi:MAG: TIGR03936 family radical SAM-associated protein [Clostridia bacterium]|nr:TIGR03936 family radical SAM-associated protein [Clostridia bacterium]
MAFPVRLWFKKYGAARFISHLDLNRTMLRAIRRADIPVWYTEGFNKHPYIAFPCPLSIFYCGENEIMDFKLETGVPFAELVSRFNEQMPEGIEVLRIAVPKAKPTSIKYADYTVRLELIGKTGEQAAALFKEARKKDEIFAVKKTKKGEKKIEVMQYFRNAGIESSDNCAVIKMVLPCGTSENLNPSLIIDAIVADLGETESFSLYTRHNCYLEDMTVFM